MSRKNGTDHNYIWLCTLYFFLMLLATPTIAAEARYKNPKVNGYALDYCYNWQANCGKPAADAFCKSKGYSTALRFHVKKNAPPTRVIGTGSTCRDAGCDRIDWVACAAEASFAHPKYQGYALDLCTWWGQACGKPAADAFCWDRGYQGAVDFAVRHDAPPTRVIGDGKICKDSFCDRIVAVTCKNRRGKSGGPGGKSDSFSETMPIPPDASEFADFEF